MPEMDFLTAEIEQDQEDTLTQLFARRNMTPDEKAVAEVTSKAPAPAAESPEKTEEATDASETPAPEAKPAEANTETPKTPRKMKLGDHEVEVDEDAEAAFRRELDTRAGKWGSEKQRYEEELRRLREQIAAVEARTTQSRADEPKDDDILPPSEELNDPNSEKYNPREFTRQLLAYQEALVLNGMSAVMQKRQQEDSMQADQRKLAEEQQNLIQRFYGTIAPELVPYRDVVGSVLRKHEKDIVTLVTDDMDEGLKALKKLTIARIAEIRAEERRVEEPPKLGVSRRAPAATATEKDDDDEDDSLYSMQRKARATRRSA